jgi:hypothetical protein
MLNITDEQKRKIRNDLELLSELISDISTIVGRGERGGIAFASDGFRENFGVDFIITCAEPAEKYIAHAFADFGVDICKEISDSVYGDYEVLGLTIDEYKKLAKGSILLNLERYKEFAIQSPEAKNVQNQIEQEFINLVQKFGFNSDVKLSQPLVN